ncbi:hypothetical protein LCD46_11190 [Enterobacter ludwigii]|uniref:hypothetical protein n=1 Tax=unclassified Enterobacter TaxID=2608935 RepID=UPI001ABED503|nr:hypothetical protein [Enterobacter ludwigii]UOY72833.1 hypothetical protein LCD46_11190 [Enterobacter ludwigii]
MSELLRPRLFICALAILSTMVFAEKGLVSPNNANYIYTANLERYVHSVPLDLTYNSRSLLRSSFGLGWCSDIGTTLTLQENGLAVNICGGGVKIILKSPSHEFKYRQFIEHHKEEFESNIAGYNEPSSDRSQLIADYLITQHNYNWYDEFNIEQYSNGPKTFLRKSGSGVISQIDSISYRFDRFGRLLKEKHTQLSDDISVYYFGGSIIGMKRGNTRPVINIDQDQFGFITQLFAKGKAVQIAYWPPPSTENYSTLSKLEMAGITISFQYSDLFNMIRKTETGEPTEEMSYDEKNDWALTHKFSNGCNYKNIYTFDTPHSDMHYFTEVIESCKDSGKQSYYFEFRYEAPKSDALYTIARTGQRTISYESGTNLFQYYSDDSVTEQRILVPVSGNFITTTPKGVVQYKTDPRCNSVADRTSTDFLAIQYTNNCKPLRVRWQNHGNYLFGYEGHDELSTITDLSRHQSYRLIQGANGQIHAVEKKGSWTRLVGNQSNNTSGKEDLQRLVEVLKAVKMNSIAGMVFPEKNDPFAVWCECDIPLFPPQQLH